MKIKHRSSVFDRIGKVAPVHAMKEYGTGEG
jgi:hypothetical protein